MPHGLIDMQLRSNTYIITVPDWVSVSCAPREVARQVNDTDSYRRVPVQVITTTFGDFGMSIMRETESRLVLG